MSDRNVSVLALDDDRTLLDVYSRAFARAGYRCITTQSGAEALGRIANEAIDVVITDLSMPGMSGVEFMRRVRERDADLPILVVTGAPAIDNAIDSIDAGVFRYITKPVVPSELVKAVGDAVHARALARARRAAYAHLAGADSTAPTSAMLVRALETMWLAVQPIVSPVERRVTAYEALLRTRDAVLRDPPKLLAAAERLEMLPSVGRAVRTLAAAIIPTMPLETDLFINLHPRDLLDDQLFSRSEALFTHAHRVVLEVTERSSLEDVPDARARVALLKGMGYRIALDDMGAGYAGLTSFAMLKPNFVKIDLTLVRDVDSDAMKQTLIRTIIGLARELNIEVIAEGVETPQERQALTTLGCTRQQGYLFARPAQPFPTVNW